MKKRMLWSALFTLMSSQIQAEGMDNNTIRQGYTIGSANEPQNNVSQTANLHQSGTNFNVTQNQELQLQLQEIQPPQVAAQAPVPNPPTVTPFNCEYKIPASMKTIAPDVVTKWAENATIHAFHFELNKIDEQLQKLQACFTDKGWVNYKNALQYSDNLEVMKRKKLNMTSQLDGVPISIQIKEDHWKVIVPLKVWYYNDQEKTIQTLNVHLLIVRKASGDLGVLEIAALPRQTAEDFINQNNLKRPTTPSIIRQQLQ